MILNDPRDTRSVSQDNKEKHGRSANWPSVARPRRPHSANAITKTCPCLRRDPFSRLLAVNEISRPIEEIILGSQACAHFEDVRAPNEALTSPFPHKAASAGNKPRGTKD